MAFRYLGIMHPHPVFILVADVLPVLEISRLHAAGAKTTVIRFGSISRQTTIFSADGPKANFYHLVSL